jgi:large subunit ribosomal protein L25
MKTIELKAQLREKVGKKATKAVRREGKIPAILYGRGLTSTPLAVSSKDFHQVTHTKAGANVLISLKMEGSKAKKETTCLIKEAQRDPVTDHICHVDFAAISLTEKIRVKVPLVIKDAEQAIGIKEGGVLDLVHHEIEVECLPTEIPERLETSVKALKIGDAIHVKELAFPPNVTPLLEGDEVVVTLHPPKKEEEVAPPAEAAAEPEVIEKGKKEKPEEGAEAAVPEKAEKAEKPEKQKPEK